MALIERDEFVAWMDVLRGDIKGVHDRLDDLNGRTRITEQTIAVHADRFNTMKDDNKAQAKSYAGRWGMVLAGAGAVVELVHQWLGK